MKPVDRKVDADTLAAQLCKTLETPPYDRRIGMRSLLGEQPDKATHELLFTYQEGFDVAFRLRVDGDEVKIVTHFFYTARRGEYMRKVVSTEAFEMAFDDVFVANGVGKASLSNGAMSIAVPMHMMSGTPANKIAYALMRLVAVVISAR